MEHTNKSFTFREKRYKLDDSHNIAMVTSPEDFVLHKQLSKSNQKVFQSISTVDELLFLIKNKRSNRAIKQYDIGCGDKTFELFHSSFGQLNFLNKNKNVVKADETSIYNSIYGFSGSTIKHYKSLEKQRDSIQADLTEDRYDRTGKRCFIYVMLLKDHEGSFSEKHLKLLNSAISEVDQGYSNYLIPRKEDGSPILLKKDAEREDLYIPIIFVSGRCINIKNYYAHSMQNVFANKMFMVHHLTRAYVNWGFYNCYDDLLDNTDGKLSSKIKDKKFIEFLEKSRESLDIAKIQSSLYANLSSEYPKINVYKDNSNKTVYFTNLNLLKAFIEFILIELKYARSDEYSDIRYRDFFSSELEINIPVDSNFFKRENNTKSRISYRNYYNSVMNLMAANKQIKEIREKLEKLKEYKIKLIQEMALADYNSKYSSQYKM
jgi:hypothetical protein